ncbi:MAG: GNAT family N-acetyltransferase, partial [Anaerolineales bacterium]
MDVKIKEITKPKDLRAFIRFPHTLRQGDLSWVPALDFDEMNTLRKDKNPAFEHCQARYFLALAEGRIVGRVAAINNRLHSEKWDQPYLRFGWIDFVDQQEVSEALMGAVETWAETLGKTAVHGPLGFTDLDREGMLVEGFDELATLATSHDQPYYAKHLARLGYEKDIDWMEVEIAVAGDVDERISRVAAISRKRYKLKLLEPKNKKELLSYAPALFEVINEAYSHLYGVVHLTDKQVEAYVKQYFGFVFPDFVPVVLDEEGRMIAFTISMPSLSRALQKGKGKLFPFGWAHLLYALKKPDRMDVYLGAVRPEYQGRGINAIMMERLFQIYQRHGIKYIHVNPMLESNFQVLGQWQYFKTRQHKRRRVFIKH